MTSLNDIIQRLFDTVRARRQADAKQSYVASLFAKGTSHIARKVGEEAIETALAAQGESREECVRESADLLFHLLVLWADRGITPEMVAEELARREGVSGIAEKQSRPREGS